MQLTRLIPIFLAACLLIPVPTLADSKAAAAKTYDEQTFMKMTGYKTRKQVVELLGEPTKKQLAVKPSNADSVIGRPMTPSKGGDNVEMWYYTNIVRYDAKRTYKTTELTFVNGVCTNVAFFNNH